MPKNVNKIHSYFLNELQEQLFEAKDIILSLHKVLTLDMDNRVLENLWENQVPLMKCKITGARLKMGYVNVLAHKHIQHCTVLNRSTCVNI